MLEKLESIKKRWEEIGQEIVKPGIIHNHKLSIQLNKEYKELQKIVVITEKYKNVLSNIENSKDILSTEKEEDFRELAKIELEKLNEQKTIIEKDIKILLLPEDPEDDKNAIVEIRAGSGGDEASIFAGDLFRMYSRYCENKKWTIEIINENPGSVGGYKEIVFNVISNGVYGILKYESGVHRVQRVPATETQGRVHTSAASVVVLPEADEFDIQINENDIRKDTFRASGAGGQHVNKTESAIRLTYIPTGLVVECQDGRSQIKNHEKALKVLRARIYEIKYKERLEDISKKRKTIISTGDRSAKIRTYNFPQGRLTDHRIGLTLYNLSNIIEGEIQELIDTLQIAENTERLKVQNI